MGRKLASELLASICNCYQSTQNNLIRRVSNQCERKISNDSSSIHSLYGSVMVLLGLGHETMEHFIHLLKIVYRKAQTQIESENNQMGSLIKSETVTARELDKSVFLGCAGGEGNQFLEDNQLIPILVKIQEKGRLARCGNDEDGFEQFFGE